MSVKLSYSLMGSILPVLIQKRLVSTFSYSVCASDAYALGDEFIYSIEVIDVDDDGLLVHHRSLLNSKHAARLLAVNAQLKSENALIALELVETQIRLEQAELEQANLLLSLVESGVLQMDWFSTVKRHFVAGRYNKENVAVFVVGSKITIAEYKTITGDEYVADQTARSFFIAKNGVGDDVVDSDVIMLIGVISTISGIILGWLGKGRQLKTEAKAEGEQAGSMRVVMEYIKRGVDNVQVEQKVQGQRFDALSERVTRVEESSKQAHRRIDRIETEKQRG